MVSHQNHLGCLAILIQIDPHPLAYLNCQGQPRINIGHKYTLRATQDNFIRVYALLRKNFCFGAAQQAIYVHSMGMGDAVLEILLREKGLLTDDSLDVQKLDYFVACLDDDLLDKAVEITAKLREKGYASNFSYKTVALKKQMKQADSMNSVKCIILGGEFKDSAQLVIKDMKTGEQELLDAREFLAQ